MFIFDAHLDLSMNALEWNRDFSRPIEEIREREKSMTDKPDRGRGTVCLPEMRRGGIGVCVATQIARTKMGASPISGWHSQAQAWAQTQGQLAWYRAMEEAGELTQIRTKAELEHQVATWLQASSAEHEKMPVGYILSLEGADSLVTLKHLERAYEYGLRAVGPAHYGPGVYAFGTDSNGGFNAKGRELLKEMDRLGMILDATHLCDECFWEAMDIFSGPVWASHSNCRALVPHNRQFDDEQIKTLVQRGAVIGGVLDAWMMIPNWVRKQSTPESTGLKLERLIDHIDHVCQIAGSAKHSGIGSDLDGAFGREQTPTDIHTIADLARLPEMFKARGYTEADISGIMSGNFLNFLLNAWH